MIWPLLAAVIAVSLEVAYRRADSFPFWALLPAMLLTYALYRTISSGPTLLLALVGFNLFVIVARTAASVAIFNEPIIKANLVALVAMLTATVAGWIWKP